MIVSIHASKCVTCDSVLWCETGVHRVFLCTDVNSYIVLHQFLGNTKLQNQLKAPFLASLRHKKRIFDIVFVLSLYNEIQLP